MPKKPLLLCILDGWGLSDKAEYNAIAKAHTPVYDRLWQNFPHTTLRTDGLAVGLPEGQFGNSEVGHTNIGAGRIVMQDLPRITQAVQDGTLAQNPALLDFIAALKQSGGTAHLMGLVSDGGVHAHQDHIAALAQILDAAGVKTCLHIFTDGRDTPPTSAAGYVAKLTADLPGTVTVATVCGRFYAMDRDKRWERVAQAFDAIAHGQGAAFDTEVAAIDAAYANNDTDEFIKPSVIGGYQGMQAGDGVLTANFRSDRIREILQALVLPDFADFDRGDFTPVQNVATMTVYADYFEPYVKVLFRPQTMDNIFGEVVARAGLKQLRAAETEKYPHVTFFFNGGREEPYEGEERLLVASPKVATYDLQPEMSAVALTDRLLEKLPEQDVVILNFANPDMVGHTGSLEAAIKAVETVDACLGRIAAAIEALGGVLLVIADHGNAEQMFDEATGQPHTAHTTNPVPCILAGYRGNLALRSGGVLADVAPTMVHILGLQKPAEMTGASLLDIKDADAA
jgi:2,3-bisphosphoglycerate-independent phosphoglycerate mutase